MEFWLCSKFFSMNVAAFIVAAMNNPPNYGMFFICFCNVRHSFLSFSHLIFHFIQKFCCVISHDENFWICLSLVIIVIGLPQSFMNFLFVPYGLPISVEKSIFMMRTNSLHLFPRSCIKFPWSIVPRNFTFPLLRGPRPIIIPLWIICIWEVIRFPWSFIFHNRFPRILIFISCLLRAWWSRTRHDRRHPRWLVHHRPWFCCDSFFSWSLLNSFRHRRRANCKAGRAYIKQTQQMIPLITCEISFG